MPTTEGGDIGPASLQISCKGSQQPVAGAPGGVCSAVTHGSTITDAAHAKQNQRGGPCPRLPRTREALPSPPRGGAQAGPEPRPPPQSPGCDRAPRGMPGASRLLGPLTVAGLMVTMGEVAVVTTTAVRLSGDLALNNGPAKWG